MDPASESPTQRHCSYNAVPAKGQFSKESASDLEQISQATPKRSFSIRKGLKVAGTIGALFGALTVGHYSRSTPLAPQPAAQMAIDYKPQARTMLRTHLNDDGVEDYAILSDIYEGGRPTGQQQVIFMISNPKFPDGKHMRIEYKPLPIQYADLDSMEITGGAKPDITLTSNLERTNPSHMENDFGTLTLYNGKDFNKRF
jgi:hypothetical protein